MNVFSGIFAFAETDGGQQEGFSWQAIWQTIVDFFTQKWWAVLEFIAVLILGIILVKIICNVVKKLFARTKMEKIAQQFVLAILKFLLYLVLVLVLLGILGIEITGIITALSAALLAVGMALQNNIANLANGIIIVACQMFKKGDYIAVDGKEGSIVDINFLFTTLMTPDNKKITLPNSTIVNSSVVNSGANKLRRVDFTFSVAYETDVELVKKIVTECMLSNGKVYADEDKAPFCRLRTLGASSIDFFANCWCDKEDYWDVYYYVLEKVYNEFKKHNVSIPYNQLEVRSRTDEVVMPFDKSDLPERVEKVRPEQSSELEKILHIGKNRKSQKKKTKAVEKSDEETKATAPNADSATKQE